MPDIKTDNDITDETEELVSALVLKNVTAIPVTESTSEASTSKTSILVHCILLVIGIRWIVLEVKQFSAQEPYRIELPSKSVATETANPIGADNSALKLIIAPDSGLALFEDTFPQTIENDFLSPNTPSSMPSNFQDEMSLAKAAQTSASERIRQKDKLVFGSRDSKKPKNRYSVRRRYRQNLAIAAYLTISEDCCRLGIGLRVRDFNQTVKSWIDTATNLERVKVVLIIDFESPDLKSWFPNVEFIFANYSKHRDAMLCPEIKFECVESHTANNWKFILIADYLEENDEFDAVSVTDLDVRYGTNNVFDHVLENNMFLFGIQDPCNIQSFYWWQKSSQVSCTFLEDPQWHRERWFPCFNSGAFVGTYERVKDLMGFIVQQMLKAREIKALCDMYLFAHYAFTHWDAISFGGNLTSPWQSNMKDLSKYYMYHK